MRLTRSSSSYPGGTGGSIQFGTLRCPKRDRELDSLRGMIGIEILQGENGIAQAHGAAENESANRGAKGIVERLILALS